LKGLITRLILYFIFSVIIYMGVISFTNKTLPEESSNMVGFFFGAITFVACFVLNWLFSRKKDKK
jgi:uncharacterized membrane protein (DUF485 family)